MRTGALLTMLDNVGGLGGGLAALPDGWVVSTNLAARVVAPAHAGPLRIDSSRAAPRPQQRRHAVQILDEGADDALVASGVLTSAILVPENGAAAVGPPDRPRHRPPAAEPRSPADHASGSASATAGDDAVEIDLADELRNPWGILHGGVVATLVDLAAEHATGGGRTTDVVLHFLAPNRVGPVRADRARPRPPRRRRRGARRGPRRRRRPHDRRRDRDARPLG